MSLSDSNAMRTIWILSLLARRGLFSLGGNGEVRQDLGQLWFANPVTSSQLWFANSVTNIQLWFANPVTVGYGSPTPSQSVSYGSPTPSQTVRYGSHPRHSQLWVTGGYLGQRFYCYCFFSLWNNYFLWTFINFVHYSG